MFDVLVLAGPTAVGKTETAIRLAKELNGEIVSADSMQLYKYMDIGSAKPSAEELAEAPHHLIGTVDPREAFTVASYQREAKKAIFDIAGRGRLPIIAGGSGLYVNSLIYDMDFTAAPQEDGKYRKELERLAKERGNAYVHGLLESKAPALAARIHENNLKKMIRALEALETGGKEIAAFENAFRPCADYAVIIAVLNRERSELYERIDRRVDMMFEAGLADEVKGLTELGLGFDDIAMKGIGYKEIIAALNGEYDMEHAKYLIKRNSRHFAKRQLTWFRRYEGAEWFELSGQTDPAEEIISWLKQKKKSEY